jgi:hypothetical protein
VGGTLMRDLIAYVRRCGLHEFCGEEFADSTGLIAIARAA